MELTVGYETNLQKNAKRKKAKYSELVIDQSDHFEKVNFVNISMSSLAVYGKECSAFISMLNDLGFNENDRKYCNQTNDDDCDQNYVLHILLPKQRMDKPRTLDVLDILMYYCMLSLL